MCEALDFSPDTILYFSKNVDGKIVGETTRIFEKTILQTEILQECGVLLQSGFEIRTVGLSFGLRTLMLP